MITKESWFWCRKEKQEVRRVRIMVEEWTPNGWKHRGVADSLETAEKVARKVYDPNGWGGFRDPKGGPDYGTIRASVGGAAYVWFRDMWEKSEKEKPRVCGEVSAQENKDGRSPGVLG